MEKVSIFEKFRTFDKYWQSRMVGEFNGQAVKLAKIRGDFEWHAHKMEDELLLILKGKMVIQFEDKTVELVDGDLFVVPCGVEHQFIAVDEVQLLVIEPKSTLNAIMKKSEDSITVSQEK